MASSNVLSRPPNIRPDWTVDQNWESFSPSDHDRWRRLYDRQMQVLEGRACDAFFRGLHALDLHGNGIPDFAILNRQLTSKFGWTIVAVPGLIPDAVFFEHLANRRFPAGNFIRSESEFDYIEAPDIFHDVFGHIPMLTDRVFGDYIQAYGQGGLRALSLNCLDSLARLYWYSVEFGLINTDSGPRIYGAGILSSPAESCFALESSSPHRVGFDLMRVMRTLYRIDDFQEIYFQIKDFNELFEATLQDFAPIYQALQTCTTLQPDTILPSDIIVQRGDQHYRDRFSVTI
ncbi:phenylalanine 4-monooxygenase [Candidatus Phycosocius spiralis]|uniref:Phenylalanine-4-hydroxylase n=1 Tax=Candidatus Phycosocius spiralis TaxID=2815099 RepID=A0ABQ4PST0_9PROT|nr:phenylalanine 4-monooxygenase [Candidatus Phycosocius spiralis]GIU66023.1 phenylalanine-4-hydroxylase [Candidatus Phycosocius spiralis]